MAEESATITPPQTGQGGSPSADDLQSQFDTPSYEGGDALDNQVISPEEQLLAQSQLSDAQNRARLQQIRAAAGADPLRKNAGDLPEKRGTGAEQYQSQPGTTIDQRLGNTGVTRTQGGNDGRVQAKDGQKDTLEESRRGGQPETQRQRNLRANREGSKPNEAKLPNQGGSQEDRLQRLRNAAKRLKQNKNQPEENPDYPYPISNVKYFCMMMIALNQDILELVFDLIGIGWIIGPLLLVFFTAPVYIYLILRHVPKSMRKKYIFPSVAASGINIIPGLGEVLPEWTAVAIGGWILLKRYEAGDPSLTGATSTTGAIAGDNKKPSGGGGGGNSGNSGGAAKTASSGAAK